MSDANTFMACFTLALITIILIILIKWWGNCREKKHENMNTVVEEGDQKVVYTDLVSEDPETGDIVVSSIDEDEANSVLPSISYKGQKVADIQTQIEAQIEEEENISVEDKLARDATSDEAARNASFNMNQQIVDSTNRNANGVEFPSDNNNPQFLPANAISNLPSSVGLARALLVRNAVMEETPAAAEAVLSKNSLPPRIGELVHQSEIGRDFEERIPQPTFRETPAGAIDMSNQLFEGL